MFQAKQILSLKLNRNCIVSEIFILLLNEEVEYIFPISLMLRLEVAYIKVCRAKGTYTLGAWIL